MPLPPPRPCGAPPRPSVAPPSPRGAPPTPLDAPPGPAVPPPTLAVEPPAAELVPPRPAVHPPRLADAPAVLFAPPPPGLPAPPFAALVPPVSPFPSVIAAVEQPKAVGVRASTSTDQELFFMGPLQIGHRPPLQIPIAATSDHPKLLQPLRIPRQIDNAPLLGRISLPADAKRIVLRRL